MDETCRTFWSDGPGAKAHGCGLQKGHAETYHECYSCGETIQIVRTDGPGSTAGSAGTADQTQ